MQTKFGITKHAWWSFSTVNKILNQKGCVQLLSSEYKRRLWKRKTAYFFSSSG